METVTKPNLQLAYYYRVSILPAATGAEIVIDTAFPPSDEDIIETLNLEINAGHQHLADATDMSQVEALKTTLRNVALAKSVIEELAFAGDSGDFDVLLSSHGAVFGRVVRSKFPIFVKTPG